MPPTVKENEISTARPDTAQRPSQAGSATTEAAAKPQPVALEVPVTVNGARTIDGSDKREPFSETTKTVLVFGSGAVIRLSSSVAPGQLLFLTNEKTKKEVVCQVVKSKNYRNVSGYVELEFTEPVVGFWGMRFPGDRIGSVPQQPTPAPLSPASTLASGSPAVPRSLTPRVEAPVNATPTVSKVIPSSPAVPSVAAKPAEPRLGESKFFVPEAPKAAIPPAPVAEERVPLKPVAPITPLSSSLSTSFDPTASLHRNAATAAPPTPPVLSATPVMPVVPVAPPVELVAPASAAIPEAPVTPAIEKPVASESVLFDAPRTSDAPASFLEPAKTPSFAPNLLSLFESKPAAPPVAPASPEPPAPHSVDPETEALRKHTERLQEQLSSMLFAEKGAEPSATVSVQIPHMPPVTVAKELAETAGKALEMSQIFAPEAVEAKPVKAEPAKPEPVKFDGPAKSALEGEELKIPAWLEPLARNAAAPNSTQELIEREKAKRLAEQPRALEKVQEEAPETFEAPTSTFAEAPLPELPLPSFVQSHAAEEDRDSRSSSSKSSGKGVLIGAIAAGVLVLAGGGWWFMQQYGGPHSNSAPATGVQASVIDTPASKPASQPQAGSLPQVNPPAQTNTAEITNASVAPNSTPSSPTIVPALSSSAVRSNSQPVSNSASKTNSAAAAAEPPKKPALGEVQFTAPKVSAKRNASSSSEDAGIALTSEDQPTSGAELGAGLVGSSNQPSAPAAPLPVGGDVKQAKLISSTPPVYPQMAKNQHISGNVTVDALIDENGRVTTMKVVSGPTLLHQSAMDALKQWKYQPATLDGKPVAMHLTVTLQFRMQQ